MKINHTGTKVLAEVIHQSLTFPVNCLVDGVDDATSLMRIKCLIQYVTDIYVKAKLEWETSKSGQKVCQCVHV